MASLASYTTLYVTAIRVDDAVDVRNIAAVRWEGDLGPEESSVADFVAWLDHGDARAYVRRSDGRRGPRIHVDHDGVQRYLRSRSEDDSLPDALLLLPQWHVSKTKKHMSRR
ncbi:hypothetical protein [Kribbella speibonae]|uniref:DUF3892 domain-containing protein n=1 Tax=Kribbella speibonae TaxID=1572660 RepID=A0A4R0IEB9_9ACTN|nr:hypothetical protein [Kribbella speibonae]TCC30829.1 hypothetical protein E0H92_37600 [Kribbella speibonae]